MKRKPMREARNMIAFHATKRSGAGSHRKTNKQLRLAAKREKLGV